MDIKVWGEWFEVEGDYSPAEPDVGHMVDSFSVEDLRLNGVSLPLDILSESFLEAAEEAALEAIDEGNQPDPDDWRDSQQDAA